jgi:hypothetical protein
VAIILNRIGFEHAQRLVAQHRFIADQDGEWSLHKPSKSAEKRFIVENGLAGFAKWHLGEDNDEKEDSPRRHKFPYGDFKNVHRCALLAAETRIAQGGDFEFTQAVIRLREAIDTAVGAAT